MKVLFLCSAKSKYINRSYPHRIVQLEKQCRRLGVQTKLLFLGDFFFGSPTLIQPLNFRSMIKQINDNYDVIHAGGSGATYVIALLRHVIGSKPIVLYDVHGDVIAESHFVRKSLFDLEGYFNAFQMLVTEYLAVNHADYYITASERLKQRLVTRNTSIKVDNVETIINGVDLDLFKPAKAELEHVESHVFTVTYAGSFLPWQGVDTLTSAAELLSDQEVKFKLIGFSVKDQGLKRSIQEKLGNNVELIDWAPRDNLIQHLSQSDVLIIPRKRHPALEVAFCTKFAEYVALQKPVIMTNIDETSDLVKKFDCGFVCEPTAHSIAETIMAAKQTPRRILLQKGYNGRRLAETMLDQNVVGEKYLKFLDKIVMKRNK